MEYTEAQKQAICWRGGDTLVSAAAGSGKTSVLSARISSLIEEGAEIRRMLVVTFTSKAATEMRGRIRRELEKNAHDKALPRLMIQAEQVDSADICTIHRFALKVIKENFAQLGQYADVHPATEEQMRIYQDEAMEEVLEELYDREDAQFLLLRDRYSGRDDVGIVGEVFRLYNYCMSRPEGTKWIISGGQAAREAYLHIVDEQNLADLGRLEDVLQKCIQLEEEYDFPEKQSLNNREDLVLAQTLKQSYSNKRENYIKLLAGAAIPAIVRKDQPEGGKARLQAYKKQARAQLKKLLQTVPETIDQEIQKELPYVKQMTSALYRIVSRFEEAYTRIKQEHHVIDYDDMMRLGYHALQDEQIASAYRARYDYVFIDEYQDTNPLQEALLCCLAPHGGRFMVGDMKQSIYRFRLADPLIFREKAENEGGVKVIHMNENFRSGDEVIHTINHIMHRLMSRHLGELEYTEEEALVKGAQIKGEAEFLLTDANEARDVTEAAECEAQSIAKKIHELLQQKDEQGNPSFQPSDICVLLRNMEKYAEIYGRVFAEAGLDIRVNSAEDSFPAASEMFLNLLKIIDGFTSDIALLSVMKSFMGGFADADLAFIRAEQPQESFSQSLMVYAQKEGELAEKCRQFLQKIEKYRRWAEVMTLKELLIRLKLSENYEAHLWAMASGEEKGKIFADFFRKLLEWAEQQVSLYELLNSIALFKKNHVLMQKKNAETSGAVQMMSIHAAKGLEFPIVFIARMNTRFSVQDKSKQFLLHNRLGISMDMVDEKNRIIKRSVMRRLAEYEQEKEQKSEELRILYVAMTRAKQKLFFSAALKNPMEWIGQLPVNARWYDLLEMSSMLEWVMTACLDLPCMQDWKGDTYRLSQDDTLNIAHTIVVQQVGKWMQKNKALSKTEVLKEVAKMPYEQFLSYHVQNVPVKVGVSALLPQDELGSFIPAYRENGEAGAELGTLIHLVMQHLDFSMQTEEEIEQLIKTLEQRKIITSKEAQRIRPFRKKICRFLHSDIAARARAAQELRKEIPFCVVLPAREIGFEKSEEQVILQGIIDLAFLEKGEYIIVDYKSNMADKTQLAQLAQHYKLQVQLYKKALEQISAKPVKACYLWFLRQEQEFEIYSHF